MSAMQERAWPQAVLFDLDGTLIDSAADIRGAVNELLAVHGLAPLPLDEVRSMIGRGIKVTVDRAFRASGRPLNNDALDRANAEMVDIYANHLTEFTQPMAGAVETLQSLKDAGMRLAVATNKPQRAAEIVLEHFDMLAYLGAVVGGDAGVAKKPAPDILLAALERMGLDPWNAVMVGDSGADVESAKAAGIPVVVIRGGYTNVPADELGADLVLDLLEQLEDSFQTLKRPAP